MGHYNGSEIINIGTGEDLSIRELAGLIQELLGYGGTIAWDTSKSDGIPRKLLDVTRLHKLGWRHKQRFREGLRSTIDWFIQNRDTITRI